jgi:hypothetical protein
LEGPISAELEARWPKLRRGNYQVSSRRDARYNCIAYANDDAKRWWEHPSGAGYGRSYRRKNYWPQNFGDTLAAWVAIFEAQGFVLINNNYEHEVGFEKVAIYVDLDDLSPTHVAKSDGYVWKSKLGILQDIEHTSLELLEGSGQFEYGMVGEVLKRAIK